MQQHGFLVFFNCARLSTEATAEKTELQNAGYVVWNGDVSHILQHKPASKPIKISSQARNV